MKLLTHMRSRLRAFAKDSSGSYSIETALIVPMLLWGMLATYTFVDGYRMQAMNLRATYTISDLLTRQWNPVDQEFLTGLGKYHEFLTDGAHATKMRVSVVYFKEGTSTYDEASGLNIVTPAEHRLVWSYSTDAAKPKFTQNDMGGLFPTMPVLANADSAVIVETWMEYQPPFDIGLPPSEFANRVVASPRFVPQLVWASASTS